MQDKPKNYAKKSEICFYVGLFFLIFSLVIFISIAVKGGYSSQSSTLSALIAVASISLVGGLTASGLSLMFYLFNKKSANSNVANAKSKVVTNNKTIISITQSRPTATTNSTLRTSSTTNRPTITATAEPGVVARPANPTMARPSAPSNAQPTRSIVTNPRPSTNPATTRTNVISNPATRSQVIKK